MAELPPLAPLTGDDMRALGYALMATARDLDEAHGCVEALREEGYRLAPFITGEAPRLEIWARQ